MSDFDNDDLPVQDELTALKARADMLGVSYHPSIGLEKLRNKVNAAVTGTGDKDEEEDKPKAAVVKEEETASQKRARLYAQAAELVRIRVTCMNPNKREWEGEIFTAGNSAVGTLKKYVPFNADEGWHVPRIIYNQIVDRQCQVFVTERTKNGVPIVRGKLIKEFAVEVLPPLTKDELTELARRQAMARSVD